MTKLVEAIAIALGGLSLFAVCFLGFAAMSGKPLDSTPLVGGLFAPEEVHPAGGSGPARSADAGGPPSERVERPSATVVEASVGMLGAWSLPSPYSATELKELVDEMKGRLQLVEAREAELDQREHELDLDQRALDERFSILSSLQTRLEQFERELELREQEVVAKERTKAEAERRRWAEVATVLASLDAAIAGQRLAEYEPEDAAYILRAMPPDTASEIVNQVPERWKEYVNAYTQLGTRAQSP